MLVTSGVELRMTGYMKGWVPDWIEIEDIGSITNGIGYIDDAVVIINLNENHNDKVIIHKGAKISSGVVLYAPVEIGPRTFIGHNTVVRDHTKFGQHCKIGGVSMYEGNNDIGEHTYINANVHITRGTIIGKYSFFGAGVIMANDSYMYHYRMGSHGSIKPPTIGKWARIGNGASLMPGVNIGDNSFVAAGSIVTHDVPDYELWMGQPAKFKKKYNFGELDRKNPCEECK